MDNKIAVALFRAHMRILIKERQTTNFGRANDNLSRAVSVLVKGRLSMAESYHWDSHFDGGEFSGPAYYRMEQKLFRDTAMQFGYPSVEALHNAVQRVTTAKFAYELFSAYNADEQNDKCSDYNRRF